MTAGGWSERLDGGKARGSAGGFSIVCPAYSLRSCPAYSTPLGGVVCVERKHESPGQPHLFYALLVLRRAAHDERVEAAPDVAFPARHGLDVGLHGGVAVGLRDLRGAAGDSA